MRFVYLIIINYNERTQGTALAWREGLRCPLASKVLRLLLKPFQKVLNSRQAAQTTELFGITQKPHHLRISRTPAEHPTTPGRFPAGFCMRENCLRHGAFVIDALLLQTSHFHSSLSPLSHVSRRGTVWFVLALQEGCAS